MEEIALISLMAVLVLLSATCSIVLGKLKMPSLIGFLVAGIIIANTMVIDDDAHTVIEVFSNLGLILLMFSIGMEIDVHKLRSQGKYAIIVSAIQLPLMVLGGMLTGYLLGFNTLQSLCLGCIISGSSTAVVMAVLKSQGKLDKEDIESLILVIIIEDIGQVIMLSMLTPMLSGSGMSTDALIILIIKIAVFMVACFTIGLYIIPRIIDWCYKRANDELISLLCIGIAFLFALLANLMGLSVAIGAFLAGVFVSMAKPHHTVEGFVEPLKSVFMAMFFISVGMEVVIGTLADNIVPILVIFASFAIFKTITVYLGVWVANGDSRKGLISAISLCAMGEFAFIIAKEALSEGVVDDSFYSSVIGAALVSMICLPFMSKYSDKLYDGLTAKMPKLLARFFAWMTRRRDGVHEALRTLSTETVKSFNKGLANVYVTTILAVIIEVAFFYAYDPLCKWLVPNFGGDDFTWRIVILVVNLIVLLYPLVRLVKSLRISLYILDAGKKKIEDNEHVKDKEDTYKFHETMSPLLLGASIDIVVVMLVPNGIDNMVHIYVSIVLLMVLTLSQYIIHKKGKTGPTPDIIEKEEEAPVQNE